MQNDRSGANPNIDLVLKRISRVYGLALAFLVFLTVTALAAYSFYSAHQSLCELINAKAEAVVDPIAREFMLGNPEEADEIFEGFRQKIEKFSESGHLQLLLSPEDRGKAQSCSASFLGSTVEIPLHFGIHDYGLISGTVSYVSWKIASIFLLTLISLIFVILRLFSLSLVRRMRLTVLDPIEDLSVGKKLEPIQRKNCVREVLDIHQNISSLTEQIQLAEEERMQLKTREKLSQLSVQVAHDIRSPLTALRIALNSADGLLGNERNLIKGAVQRIDSIANELIGEYRITRSSNISTSDSFKTSVCGDQQQNLQSVKISELIEKLIVEKRMEYMARSEVAIDFEPSDEATDAFAELNPDEFNRVISNLVNNAAEAMGDKGRITVSLEVIEKEIRICVADNGVGIPTDVIPTLTARGRSFGKPQGTGLGLYHARKYIEEWSGRLSIVSRLGQGTKIAISLKLAE